MADTTTILTRLITALTSQDPTWDVVPGTAEYKILEAVAQELATATNNNTLQNYSFDVTTKSGSALDDFCALFGIFRDQGKRSSGNATFSSATTGLTGGQIKILNATGGSFSASYNGTTISNLAYNISASTLQSQLSTILPSGTSINISYSSPTWTINIPASIPLDMLSFDFSSVTNTSAPTTLSTSWVPYGGASSNYEIPLGTQIYAPSAATGTVPVYYQTTASASLPQYSNQVQVPIQSVLTGSNNNLSAGTISALATALPGITQVTNSALAGGTDAETDDQLRQRWQNTVFKNLSGTEDQFRALALSNPGTSRVKVLGPQEQNVENLQIQTTFKINQKYNGTAPSSTTINSTDTFNLFFQVTTVATWVASPSAVPTPDNTAYTVIFTIPSGQTTSGIKTGMNVYSYDYPIPLTAGLVVSTITLNGDGTTTIVASQIGGSTQPITSNTSIAQKVSFCVPVSALPTEFDGSTTIQTLQTRLNNVVNGSVISDLSQIISLTPTYNSGNLSITATSGSYIVSYKNSSGNISPISISYGNFNNSSTLQTALNNILVYDNYKAIVSITNSSSPFTYVVDFYTLYSNIPVDISIINANLSFDFTALTGTNATGLWAIPTGTSGTVKQLATCNIQFAKPNSTNLVVIAGRIDSATTGTTATTTVTDASCISTDYQSAAADRTYVYGSNIPYGAYISAITTGTNFAISASTVVNSVTGTASLGGTGIQLVFNGINNPYSLTNSITTSVTDAIYIYPQGIESLRSNLSTMPSQETASFNTDYTYSNASTSTSTISSTVSSGSSVPYTWTYTASNNFSAGQTITITNCSVPTYNGTYIIDSVNSTNTNFTVLANTSTTTSSGGSATGPTNSSLTLNIINGSFMPWLYPGNIPILTYYMIPDASRNRPTVSGISTNYVDVIIDGATQQLIVEDIVMNVTNTTNITPGCSGVFDSINQTKWVLGDKITNPPVEDLFYIFSQQPVIQPWFGIYPQKAILSQANGNHTSLQAYSGPIGGSDPVVANITTTTSSYNMTAGTRSMYPVYYQEFFYLPEAFTSTTTHSYGVAKVSDYSQTGNTITADIIANNSGTYPNVSFTSDIYPIYDNTINQGSTQSINGIGIRQNVHNITPTGTTNTGSGTSKTVACIYANNSYLGKKVSATGIPSNTRITSVIPNVSFTMNNAATATGSRTLTITDFIITPTINTGDLIFGLQYYIDSDVVAVDNLIQQQRLVGVSTMTHFAKETYYLVNLVVVLSSSTDFSTANANINTQIGNYLNSLPFGESIQVSTITRIALSTSGVLNARLATFSDNSGYYGIQEVTPYTYYDSIQEITQNGASSVDYRDIIVKNSYTKDVQLGSDDLPALFRVNLYTRSQSDF